LNNHCFQSTEELIQTLKSDLSKAAGASVSVQLDLPEQQCKKGMKEMVGKLLDRLDLEIDPKQLPDPVLLQSDTSLGVVEESLVSHLLRSNCPVTAQPDWASIQINYVGPTIDEEGLLRYLISFRTS
jgi:7-cyano-7-deazaguanine reductase